MINIRRWIYNGVFVPVVMLVIVVAIIPVMIGGFLIDTVRRRIPGDEYSVGGWLDDNVMVPCDKVIYVVRVWARIEDPMFWKILKDK